MSKTMKFLTVVLCALFGAGQAVADQPATEIESHAIADMGLGAYFADRLAERQQIQPDATTVPARITLKEPLTDKLRNELSVQGVTFVRDLGDNVWRAAVTAEGAVAALANAAVQGVGEVSYLDKASIEVRAEFKYYNNNYNGEPETINNRQPGTDGLLTYYMLFDENTTLRDLYRIQEMARVSGDRRPGFDRSISNEMFEEQPGEYLTSVSEAMALPAEVFVSGFRTTKTVIVRLDPRSELRWFLDDERVRWVELPPHNVAPTNATSRRLTSVDQVQRAPRDLNGFGVSVGVWEADEGNQRAYVNRSHQALTGRVQMGNENNVTSANVNARESGHATHVAGTIGADDTNVTAAAKGMAPQVRMFTWNSTNDVNCISTPNCPNVFRRDIVDEASEVPWSFEKLLISASNHSYGSTLGWDPDPSTPRIGLPTNSISTTDQSSLVTITSAALVNQNDLIAFQNAGWVGGIEFTNRAVYRVTSTNVGSFIIDARTNANATATGGGGNAFFQKYRNINANLFGAYTLETFSFDSIVHGKKRVIVKAAGNDRDDGINGFFAPRSDVRDCNVDGTTVTVDQTCIDPFSSAKNVFTIGAVAENTTTNELWISSFSGFGPTLDGRIKPDFVAHGGDGSGQPRTQVLSTGSAASPQVNNQTHRSQGTSMAAPAVAGVIALLFEQGPKNSIALDADSVKAVLAQTADDVVETRIAGRRQAVLGGVEAGEYANTGPDYSTGWGVPNAEEAVNLLDCAQPPAPVTCANGRGLHQDTISNPTNIREFEFTVDARSTGYTQPLKITLAWSDPPGDPSTSQSSAKLVNNLDLRLIDPNGGVHLPWLLDPTNPGQPATRGDDNLNPIEQVVVEPANILPGAWKVRVIYDGSQFAIDGDPTNDGDIPQEFALAGIFKNFRVIGPPPIPPVVPLPQPVGPWIKITKTKDDRCNGDDYTFEFYDSAILKDRIKTQDLSLPEVFCEETVDIKLVDPTDQEIDKAAGSDGTVIERKKKKDGKIHVTIRKEGDIHQIIKKPFKTRDKYVTFAVAADDKGRTVQIHTLVYSNAGGAQDGVIEISAEPYNSRLVSGSRQLQRISNISVSELDNNRQPCGMVCVSFSVSSSVRDINIAGTAFGKDANNNDPNAGGRYQVKISNSGAITAVDPL